MKDILKGIRVIDLSRVIAGPMCTMLLGELGAEIIKVEKLGHGDDGRIWGPWAGEKSLYFSTFNKDKKSVVVDFRRPEAISILLELLEKADVLVENYRPGTLEKMGLGKQVLARCNPRLVVTSISGFGQTGPYRDRLALDPLVQAMVGLASMTGTPEGGPTLYGTNVVDITTGLYAAYGTVAALFQRQFTGQGQYVDAAMFDSAAALLSYTLPDALVNGAIPQRIGSQDRVSAPAGIFPAKDGYIYLLAGKDSVFQRLTQCMNRPDLWEKYGDFTVRFQHSREVEEIVARFVADREVEELDRFFSENGVAACIVNDIGDLIRLPHTSARELYEYVEYPDGQRIPVPGATVKFSQASCKVHRRPPLLGEHTLSVLQEVLGYSPEQCDRLRRDRIIQTLEGEE